MLRALEIMAHFDPLMWVIESGHRAAEDDPPVHGAPDVTSDGLMPQGARVTKKGAPDVLLQVRDSVQEADPTVDQHALETKPRAVQKRQPVRRVGGRKASEGRSRGASTHGGSAREG